MDIAELIERAKKATGSQLAVGEKIGRPHSRISEWKAGRRKPDAADIMLLAEVAGLPPLETLAEIECQLDADRASVWQRALSSLRAASVTAALALLVWTGLGMAPDHAQASIPYPDSSLPSHGRGHWFDPSTAHQRHQAQPLAAPQRLVQSVPLRTPRTSIQLISKKRFIAGNRGGFEGDCVT